MQAAHNQWNCEWHMRTLRDSARNYLGNSLANRLKKEEEKQTTKQDTVEAMAACSETDEHDRIAVDLKSLGIRGTDKKKMTEMLYQCYGLKDNT